MDRNELKYDTADKRHDVFESLYGDEAPVHYGAGYRAALLEHALPLEKRVKELEAMLGEIVSMSEENHGNAISTHIDLIQMSDKARAVLNKKP